MKARIIARTYGKKEVTISQTIYDVVKIEKDKNILVVGQQDDKPITMSYKDDEVFFLHSDKCECGNDLEVMCPACGTQQCWGCTKDDPEDKNVKYCSCGQPLEY